MGTDCIEWTGNRDAQGYGRKWVGGRSGHLQRVHRLAWEGVHGPIPEGMCVLHHCDNPPCFNIDHLFLGTRADNARDRVAKGRNRTTGQAAKTTCPHGHVFDEGNTYVIPSTGSRVCRTCQREKNRRQKAKARLAQVSS